MSIEEYPRLYHLTLRPPDAVSASVFCSFTTNNESLVVARGQWLELYDLNTEEELILVCRVNLFATIRCLDRIHIPGVAGDRLVLTSDSGELSVLNFDKDARRFVEFASESVALSGMNREFPGEYLAVDPRGRAAMVASINRLRSVMVFHEEGMNSPSIDANLSSTFCYSVVALDNGYENPAFVCLERFRFSKKALAVYEFNLGLNHIIKTWSHEVPDNCDIVIALPGDRNGPSGMLVFEGKDACYRDVINGEVKAKLSLPDEPVCAELVELGRKNFFVLVCTKENEFISLIVQDEEDGDQISLSSSPVDIEPSSVPSYPISITTSKSGLLFFNVSSGDHGIYQVVGTAPAVRLEKLADLTNISPVTTSLLQRRQILIGKGQSSNSSGMALLRPGQRVEELASTPLPAVPDAVFATKRNSNDDFDNLIVISFNNDTTTTLEVGEEGAVEEVSEADTGIATDFRTLGVSRLISGVVQIHSKGVRYIIGSSPPKITPWLSPSNSRVVAYASTPTQLALALSNNEVVYFEEKLGSLLESQYRLELSKSVTAITFAGLLPNEIKSTRLFAALDDETIRQYNVPNLKQSKIHTVSYLASSIVHCANPNGPSDYMCVGHFNGTVSRIQDGETMIHVIGSAPVELNMLSRSKDIIAVSSRIWLFKRNQPPIPLLGTPTQGLKACHEFSTEDIPQGCLIGVKASTLEVFNIEEDTSRSGFVLDLSSPVGSMPTSAAIVKTSHSDLSYMVLRDGSICIGHNSFETSTVSPSTESNSETPKASVNVRFESQKQEYLAVATQKKIIIFRYISPEDNHLELMHETQVGNECSTLIPFNGQLLAGVGNALILYELGQKQLLRQGGLVLSDLFSIKALKTSHNLIYVGDARRSVSVVKYDAKEGFRLVGADPIPRSVGCMLLLDTKTVCIGDRFGNISVLRFNSSDAPVLSKPQDLANLVLVANFWVPDAIVGLHRGILSPVAGTEAIVYIGLQGTIGVLIPFISNNEYEFHWALENNLQELVPESLVHSNIKEFRNCYSPLRNVIDGDFCEYATSGELDDITGSSESLLTQVAELLESTPVAIRNRLETSRYRSVVRTI